MSARGRDSDPVRSRAPAGRGAPRGATRSVAATPPHQPAPPVRAHLPLPGQRSLWSLLGVLVLGGLLWAGYSWTPVLMAYLNRPVAKVVVEGDLAYASREGVQQNIAWFAERNFFDVDLAGMRQSLESMPWIAHAEVRRVWPDQLIVRLEEQLPIARWGDRDLLSSQGQTFRPSELKQYESLPQLAGPDRARQRIMQHYQMLGQMLRPMGFSIRRLELRERGSWFLDTGQGIELLLGRDHLIEKIRRFGTIYQQALRQQGENIARIDLRYSSGLAVGWRGPVSGAAGAAASGKN